MFHHPSNVPQGAWSSGVKASRVAGSQSRRDSYQFLGGNEEMQSGILIRVLPGKEEAALAAIKKFPKINSAY